MEHLRVSIGTAIALCLKEGRMPHPPTTAYIMVGERCISNCSFCSQARDATSSSDRLSRVTWPRFEEAPVLRALRVGKDKGINRICLQVLVDPEAVRELPDLVRRLRSTSMLPISVSISPISNDRMADIKEAGADRIGIAIDAPSERVFDRIKGGSRGNPYTFEGHWGSLKDAVGIFGRGKVSTHIIIGLGETDREVYEAMVRARSMGILISLFAYTHVVGTDGIGAPPVLGRYRALQILRSLVFDIGIGPEAVSFREDGQLSDLDWSLIVPGTISSSAFATRGCPDCNRPYYTERPMGPIYNHPSDPGLDVLLEGIEEVKRYVRS
jgi:biotin synthase-related radical SAM superfamily protein